MPMAFTFNYYFEFYLGFFSENQFLKKITADMFIPARWLVPSFLIKVIVK